MKKWIILSTICFLLVLWYSIQLKPNEIKIPTFTNDQYKKSIAQTLNGFYEDRYEAFEIYYTAEPFDEKERFYQETYQWYEEGKYREIIDYLACYGINVVEDGMFEIPRKDYK